MRKIVVFCPFLIFILLLSNLQCRAQNYATKAWVAEHFGENFVPAQEVGLGELEILFTEDQLKYDKMSLVIPFERNGVLAYHLVQHRYTRNESEQNDTLSLKEAEQVMKFLGKSGRQLFADGKVYFLRTKEISLVHGIKYSKTIVCDKKSYSVIDLPVDVSVVVVGKKSGTLSYVSEVMGDITISLDMSDGLKNKEELYGSSVMTLVNLVPSQ